MKIIEPLTNRLPMADRGGRLSSRDSVSAGLRFSGKPTKPGWNPLALRKRGDAHATLGYTKYVAQGGDWGNAISE